MMNYKKKLGMLEVNKPDYTALKKTDSKNGSPWFPRTGKLVDD